MPLTVSETCSEAFFYGGSGCRLNPNFDHLRGFQSLKARNSTGESIVRLKKVLKQFMKLDELTSEMVHRFIDMIEVQTDGSININYKLTATALLTA
ncbi:DUF4368 domain-containing protein [Paenibacillus sp. FSL H7-0737]|uniref:DUF4368 domain-containing protein n=1 Tax=unclassified Paenibacillus TaxID=185978 RepID=UPI0022AE945B|nr:DUF4368 domain-containing protein [Paenibacillus sp. FSL H7-0737]